jgi:hypothetical protein
VMNFLVYFEDVLRLLIYLIIRISTSTYAYTHKHTHSHTHFLIHFHSHLTPHPTTSPPPNTETRWKFIYYSALDAKVTHDVFTGISAELAKNKKNMDWVVNNKILGKMNNFYDKYFRDFGELLTDMEKNGIMLDNKHLEEAEIRAKEERSQMLQVRIIIIIKILIK